MKKLLTTAAVILAAATPAFALDLGNGWAFDNEVTLKYYVESQETAATYEGELSYAVTSEVSLYARTEVDLKDLNFTEIGLGATYTPQQLKYVSFSVEAQLDNSLSYNQVALVGQLRF
jgi:spermidine/putrescine-binding protein